MSQEPTMQEVLTAINNFASEVQRNFDAVQRQFVDLQAQMDKRFDEVDQRFEQVDARFNDIYTILDRLNTDVRTIKEDKVGIIEWLKRHERRLDGHDIVIANLQST
jgi:hypothetical protein